MTNPDHPNRLTQSATRAANAAKIIIQGINSRRSVERYFTRSKINRTGNAGLSLSCPYWEKGLGRRILILASFEGFMLMSGGEAVPVSARSC